jgi:hypothetical protein
MRNLSIDWIEAAPSEPHITGLSYQLQDGECTLTWQWPEDVQAVYIYSFSVDYELSLEERPAKSMKLYTREEYKVGKGYQERVNAAERHGFIVYPCVRQDGKLVAIKQEDEGNRVQFSAGKAIIRYGINYRKSLFGKHQSVRIQITSEVHVKKEVLCFVKKEGSFPLHKDDGIVYPFIHDFEPGRNVMSEIEIQKNEHIKLFFTDGKKYGQIYELMPE